MTGEARYTIRQAEISGRGLAVDWADGHRSQYHAVWLRHQCECKTCGTPMTALRGVRLHQIPNDISVVSLDTVDGDIHLRWSDDDHQSAYTARWLRDHCYCADERALRKHRPNLWDGSIAGAPPLASLTGAEASPKARLAMLEAVRDFGFCRISDVPTEPGQSHRLIEIVGPQRQTHYGTYTLSKKAAVDNVGDTASALDPHIDETYRLSTIGITVFQVLRPSSNGGASTLVDGFEAVRRLREAWPEDFDLLTKVPITAHRLDAAQNSGGQRRWYMSRLPVIKLDHDGDVSGVRLNERQIAPLDIDADLVEPCYRALRRIFDILYDPELRVTFPLQAGEGLLFDNQRVLHGRTEYTPEEPPRSVLTSSVDLEEFHSTLRLLQHDVGLDAPPMVLSQGMAV
ncbi:MAG: TauD/TfdA family dioxygenase [Hyphomicrobiales bacterium]|nr:TauD/TfdA family dioxygenase [Hyphomicrobiales bacterium]